MARKKTPADLRRALIEAAVALADQGGIGAIGLREAARRAGVTHGAPYRHFESREVLVAAVAEDGFRKLLDHTVDALAAAGPNPLDRFGAIGVAYLEFAFAHPGQFRVMFGVEAARQGDGVKSAEGAVFALCVSAIVGCQRAGLARVGDPQSLALVAWSAVHGYAQLRLDGFVEFLGLGAANDQARWFTKAVFLGLAAPEAPPGRTTPRSKAPKPRRQKPR